MAGSTTARSLSEILRDHFSKKIRQRGFGVFIDEAVQIDHGTTDTVYATVQGTDRYFIDIHFTPRGRKLSVSCTCPYFDQYAAPCKHLWATLLAAEGQDMLDAACKSRGGAIRLELADSPEDDFDAEYGDEDFDDGWGDDADEAERPMVSSFPTSINRSQRRPTGASVNGRRRKPKVLTWADRIEIVQRTVAATAGDAPPIDGEVLYVIDHAATLSAEGMVVETMQRKRKRDGGWSKRTRLGLTTHMASRFPDESDRRAVSLLLGTDTSYQNRSSWYYDSSRDSRCLFRAPCGVQRGVAQAMITTGRAFLRRDSADDDLQPLRWEDEAWEFLLLLKPQASGRRKSYELVGVLERGEERIPLSQPDLLLVGGLVFRAGAVSPLDHGDSFQWIAHMQSDGSLTVPARQIETFLRTLFELPRLPRLELPEDLRYEEVAVEPRPRLCITAAEHLIRRGSLTGRLTFDYDGLIVEPDDRRSCLCDTENRRLMRRDADRERAAADTLGEMKSLDIRSIQGFDGIRYDIPARRVPAVVRTLTEAGWWVEAEGRILRQAGNFKMDVRTGIDWFELHGAVSFGEHSASLPDLLKALKRGEEMVRLDDGTYGLVPEEWLKRFAHVAAMGQSENGHVRFRRSQIGLLDALLAAQPEVDVDAQFDKARKELLNFDGIEPIDPTQEFTGTLRPYQRDGLGWLNFLQRFGFGGCLADDMGLGKTVQVLALLEARRAGRERVTPSLVVAPRALIFNWKEEAARFAPRLRLLDHTGIQRVRGEEAAECFAGHDLILTTYGTLRRDAAFLKDIEFDYVILDESQAIKNADTGAAKAARLLRADHRLALSGTPIENHLGELWSLFEFLNPGMLGVSSAFVSLHKNGAAEENRASLARALRPVILRRTKQQVAADLPEKTEQTIWCELPPKERRAYRDLLDHYRASLLGKIEEKGMAKSKFIILEALLRLRQAACHPGLIDAARRTEPCAKLESLLPQLQEVISEGHKALVFSQFTSFLSIVREQLDAQKITYEYLDGRTRDRQAKVERFQTDPNCPLFLISLKAGGFGLNLTAAEYVFLLDPWWNPAVEQQAIDRAHRIGQSRRVFAYRLVAQDTVEHRILELQESKRDLAASILNADASLIRTLRREDVEMLLS